MSVPRFDINGEIGSARRAPAAKVLPFFGEWENPETARRIMPPLCARR